MNLAICGFSRSGTTLLQQMLRQTVTNAHVFPREYPYEIGLRSDYDRTITKRPLDVGNVPQMVQDGVIPILSVRDPRGVLTSKHKSVPGRYFCGYKQVCFSPHGVYKHMRYYGSLDWTWQKLRPILSDHQVVRYEHLVSAPDEVQQELGSRFDLEYSGAFSDFWRGCRENGEEPAALNGVRPVDPNNVNRWKLQEHDDRIRDQFSEHPELFEILIELGYEEDRVWFYRYLVDI